MSIMKQVIHPSRSSATATRFRLIGPHLAGVGSTNDQKGLDGMQCLLKDYEENNPAFYRLSGDTSRKSDASARQRAPQTVGFSFEQNIGFWATQSKMWGKENCNNRIKCPS